MPTPAQLALINPKLIREQASAAESAAWLADPSAPPRKGSLAALLDAWEQEAREQQEPTA